eukprot:CAMPEP_0114579408 /NCGR_PEP_ID=MMETSP0125-20121206/3788_1 /TAXON_ID=485358 ORGANISM="Aristerostoma sp., Strain ATCC 50986" /NCGR_SAMPLE_ID=MMETSP0125 /ASSEMBLY_ACC=CAM_ASM_000245 /LENGTH=51 /DNA_ID=CAMNT_0001770129 /DNA_START=201 /DNA_END=356 /DNA_ORIENTATION=-
MNGLRILDDELAIKPSEKTETFLGEWVEIKKKEYAEQNKETDAPEDFEKYL